MKLFRTPKLKRSNSCKSYSDKTFRADDGQNEDDGPGFWFCADEVEYHFPGQSKKIRFVVYDKPGLNRVKVELDSEEGNEDSFAGDDHFFVVDGKDQCVSQRGGPVLMKLLANRKAVYVECEEIE